MSTFVFGDVHGRLDALESLLLDAEIIDADGDRIDTETEVVSVGDLMNVTLGDLSGDSACLARVGSWVDKALVGNHEGPFALKYHPEFGGYHCDGALFQRYRSLMFEGKIVPALLVGDTLVTHAGVSAYFGFETAEEAYDAITDVWANYGALVRDETKFFWGETEIPKYLLLDGIGRRRGGTLPFGGILWNDFDTEPLSQRFSQVFGHTPQPHGPVVTEWYGSGYFHLNIDKSAKSGLAAAGVWLDAEGHFLDLVVGTSLHIEA